MTTKDLRNSDWWGPEGLPREEQLAQPSPSSDIEKWATLFGGAALLGYGMISRRKHSGLASSLLGGYLMAHGASLAKGASPLSDAMSQALGGMQQVQRTVTIERPANELYRLFRRASELPKFMLHIESVTEIAPNRQHWVLNAPLGKKIEWQAEITVDQPEVIAWRVLPNKYFEESGSIEFVRETQERTQVRMSMFYKLLGGKAGSGAATLLGYEPEQLSRESLRRFKQYAETGEIATTIGQTAGKRGLTGSLMEAMLGEETRQAA